MLNEMGAITTKKYFQGRFEGADKISGEYIADLMKSRPNAKNSHRCMSSCVISCSNVIVDEKGETVVSGFEYETIALMGSNCMIDDIDIIARMNRVCNDVGGAIAVAMEAEFLPWGDGQRALEMVTEIAKGTKIGKMIGNGCKYTGETLVWYLGRRTR
jgi:aldehyde:ferredoxin oxidoreductase